MIVSEALAKLFVIPRLMPARASPECFYPRYKHSGTDMVFQALRTRFPLRNSAGMTELGLLQEPAPACIKQGGDFYNYVYSIMRPLITGIMWQRAFLQVIVLLLPLATGCTLRGDTDVYLIIESRDENGDLLPDARVIINGIEKGVTDGNGLFSGIIKTTIGRDVSLKAVKDNKSWKTVFKIYPKIDDIKRGEKRDGFEGDIKLDEEVAAIAEAHQKGEYRFIAILAKNN